MGRARRIRHLLLANALSQLLQASRSNAPLNLRFCEYDQQSEWDVIQLCPTRVPTANDMVGWGDRGSYGRPVHQPDFAIVPSDGREQLERQQDAGMDRLRLSVN